MPKYEGHSLESGFEPAEGERPRNEIRISDGDAIRIHTFEEVGYKRTSDPTSSPEVYKNELPPEELEAISKQLSKLPFHIGANEKQGTFGNSKRPTHDATLRFLQTSESHEYKGPEREDLVFVFDNPDVMVHGVYPETSNGLEMHVDQGAKKGQERVIMSFTPEKVLKLGKRTIKDVRLVMPMPEGN